MMAEYQINFNQDFTSITVLSENALRLFSIAAPDRVDEIFVKDNATEQIRMVERLFNSSLIVLVTAQKPNCLRMMHFKKKQDICNCFYPSEILSVRMNRQRLIVCLAQSIHIHDIRDMKILHSIENIAPNEQGLCALSLNSHLAFPICSSSGELRIFNAHKLRTGMTIKAHDTPLSALCYAPSGALLATASERGTVIRVFCVKNGQRVQEFRRGVKRCVRIASLVFSVAGDFICATSNTQTVHVFRIDAKAVEAAELKANVATITTTTTTTAAAAGAAAGKAHEQTPTKNATTGSANASGAAAQTSTSKPAASQKQTEAKQHCANATTATTVTATATAAGKVVTTNAGGGGGGWSDYFSKAVSSYLIPTQVSDVLAQDRAFATVMLAQPGLRHTCALTRVGKELHLLIACEDGFLYMHEFNQENGGVCKLQSVHDLRGALDGGVIELNLSESLSQTSLGSTDNQQINASTVAGAAASPTVGRANLPKSCASSVLIEDPEPLPDHSYAGILKGEQTANTMTDSAKFRKLCDAIDTPTKLYDERQFPPVAIAAKD